MKYRVIYAPEASQHLLDIYNYITEAASSSETALEYVRDLVAFCDSFGTFPHRGTQRDDIAPGLRISHFRRRTVIAFAVEGDRVIFAGFFHGGQDYERRLRDEG